MCSPPTALVIVPLGVEAPHPRRQVCVVDVLGGSLRVPLVHAWAWWGGTQQQMAFVTLAAFTCGTHGTQHTPPEQAAWHLLV